MKKKKGMETNEMLEHEQTPEVEPIQEVLDGEQSQPRTVEEMEKLLAEEQKKSQTYMESWQRAQADYSNLKRRTDNERASVADEAKEKIIKKILPIIDDFERGLQNVPEELKASPWVTGVAMIDKKFKTFLEQERISEIPALDQPFNPNVHEAVQIDEDSSGDKDVVSEVYQKGYKIGDKVIRPAVVKVSKK